MARSGTEDNELRNGYEAQGFPCAEGRAGATAVGRRGWRDLPWREHIMIPSTREVAERALIARSGDTLRQLTRTMVNDFSSFLAFIHSSLGFMRKDFGGGGNCDGISKGHRI